MLIDQVDVDESMEPVTHVLQEPGVHVMRN